MMGGAEAAPRRAVEGYFAVDAPFWRDVYHRGDVFSAGIQRRQAVALDWVDQLSLAPQDSVLEVGCGAGGLAVELARRGLRVQAIDPVASMVALTRELAAQAGRLGQISVGSGDAHALEFPDASFGLVTALGVLPWLGEPAQAIREMGRVLKPGGWLIVSADNRRCLVHLLDPWRNAALRPIRRTIRRMLGRREQEPAPRPDRPNDIDRMLHEAGLRKRQSLTCGFGPPTLRHRPVLPDRMAARLDRQCQHWADRGLPGIRSAGWHYLVLAAREHPDG